MKFLYKDTSRLDNPTIEKTASTLQEYITLLKDMAKTNTYEDLECSINLPFDTSLLEQVQQLKAKKESAIRANFEFIWSILIKLKKGNIIWFMTKRRS